MESLEEILKSIDEEDKKRISAIGENFSQLKFSDEQDPQTEHRNFFERLLANYGSDVLKKEPERRSLFVEALQKITSYALTPHYVYTGRGLCGYLFDIEKFRPGRTTHSLPTSVLASWVRSLDHITQGESDRGALATRMQTYFNISKAHLGRYCPAHKHVLDLLSLEGALYGLEGFMFDLAQDHALDYNTSEIYFRTLQKVPDKSRQCIKDIRKETEESDHRLYVDKVLYRLIALVKDEPSDIAAALSLVQRQSKKLRQKNLAESIISFAQSLGELITRDRHVFQYGTHKVNVSRVRCPPDFYVELLDDIARSDTSMQDKDACIRLFLESITYRYQTQTAAKQPPLENFKNKIRSVMEEMSILDEKKRKKALELTERAAKAVLDDPFGGTGDGLWDTVIKTFQVNQKKAERFFEILLEELATK